MYNHEHSLRFIKRIVSVQVLFCLTLFCFVHITTKYCEYVTISTIYTPANTQLVSETY